MEVGYWTGNRVGAFNAQIRIACSFRPIRSETFVRYQNLGTEA